MSTSHSLSTHQLTPPDFSIVTIHEGSGDAPDRLFCAVASLADQDGVKSEHVLQHSGGVTGLWNKLSRELTLSKKAPRYTLRLLEEKKAPFYEAVPRAMARVTGTIVGFLQAEEQYLPGALAAVEKYFQTHPEVDVLLTGSLLQQDEGKKPIPHAAPLFSLEYLWTASPCIKASTLFFRTSLLKKDFSFNPSYQDLMLQEWLLRLLQAGKKVASLNIPTTFRCSQNHQEPVATEKQLPPAPTGVKFLKPWWQWRHSLAMKKALRHFPASTPCLGYDFQSLTERRKLG